MILGFFIGFSPYLLFEIRNNFFNFNEMFRYIFGRTSGGGRSVIYIFTDIPVIVSKLLYGVANIWIGWATILFMIITGIVYIKHKENTTYYNFILFLIGIVLIVSLLYGKHLESYYLITIHTSIRIFFAAFVVYILGKRTVLLGVFLLIMLLVNMPYWNVQKPIHDLQDGLAMRDFDKAAQIIREDNGSVTFNVAMDAQRDNRAIPLRYFLTLYDVPVMHYDDYGSAPYLYFIAGTDKPLSEITVWEYTSFGSDDIVTSWILNDEYTLYKLTK